VKLTRRQLVIAAAAGSAALKASAQSAPAPVAPQTPTDKVRQNAETLAKFAIPITTEPAFQFKA
jgi:hypothetical protein